MNNVLSWALKLSGAVLIIFGLQAIHSDQYDDVIARYHRPPFYLQPAALVQHITGSVWFGTGRRVGVVGPFPSTATPSTDACRYCDCV